MTTPSPCTGHCTVSAKGICQGCGRTLDEIAAWSSADDTTRQAITRAAAARRETPPKPR